MTGIAQAQRTNEIMNSELLVNERASEKNAETNTNFRSGVPASESDKEKRSIKSRKNFVNKREVTPMRYLSESSEEADSNDYEISYNDKRKADQNSNGQKTEEFGKKESLSEMAQHELIVLFNKTKKTITSAAMRGRERFRKYDKSEAKRSQSAPEKVADDQDRNRIAYFDNSVPREYCGENSFNISDENTPFSCRYRKPDREKIYSKKIIEILDVKVSEQEKDSSSLKVCFLPVKSLLDIPRHYQLHKKQFRTDYLNIKILMRRCMCELFIIMVFCGFGGLIFKFTEGSFESYYKCGVRRVKRDFIDMLWHKSHNLREDDWKSLARTKLRTFEEELHSAHEAGMTEYSGSRSWSFLNGIVYSLTIVTTIGYGHMYPKTHTGRALSIVYALIGIPLFLIALTDFGKLFTRGIKFIWSFVRRLYYTGSCRRARKRAAAGEIMKGAQMFYEIATFQRSSAAAENSSNSDLPSPVETPITPALSAFEIDDEFNLPISVALFILVAYIICGAVMYMVIEKWEFFEAFYFVFISMSTIGFGDYVPRDPVFMIGSIIYLVFGLALMSMCINVVQAKLSETFKQASAKIGATIGLQVNEDGSIITATPVNEEIVPHLVTTT